MLSHGFDGKGHAHALQVDNCKVFCVVSLGMRQAGLFQACGVIAAALLAIVPHAFGENPIPPLASELAPLHERTGGGNLTASESPSRAESLFEALAATGGSIVRLNSYGWRDAAGHPAPATMDAAIGQAYAHKVTPILLLEYYQGRYASQTPQPIGSYEQWRTVGMALAARFRPGGDWARQHGVNGWGVTVYSAINEPDIDNLIDKTAYHDALAGLADGVHAIDPSLRVIPGGFATCNSALDPTLRGYGTAIADLLNDRKLDGIDLHMYYHDRWFPIANGRDYSAQHCFDAVKRAAGITRDINYYSTEYDIAVDDKSGAVPDGPRAADEFITAFWDQMGVVGDKGEPVTVAALPWELGKMPGPEPQAYAMTASIHPWHGDARGELFRSLMRLAGGMHFVHADPQHTGQFELADNNARLIVWQDRPNWTNDPGTSFHLTLSPDEHNVEVWSAQGLLQKTRCTTHPTCEISGLTPGHTYMFRLQRSEASE